MGADPTIITAFIAGIISFLSPCVLPLVPGYVAMLSGSTPGQAEREEKAALTAVMVNSILFVVGFSTVFIALGASASFVGAFLQSHKLLLGRIAGGVILLFGVFLLLPPQVVGKLFPQLYSDTRKFGNLNPGKGGSFLLGLAFAFGWTPCIGPILGATLMMAATRDTLAQGIFLLAIYSAGLAIPFLLTAFAIDKFMAFYKNFRRYLAWVERAAGVLLVIVGLLMATNQFTRVSSYLSFMNEFVLWLENLVT